MGTALVGLLLAFQTATAPISLRSPAAQNSPSKAARDRSAPSGPDTAHSTPSFGSKQDSRASTQALQKHSASTFWSFTLTDAIVAAFTVVLAVIAYLQRQTMEAQRTTMEKQERRMEETIEAMSDSATEARSEADRVRALMEEQRAAMRDQAIAMRDQATAMQAQSDQLRQSVELSRQEFAATFRPKLVVRDVHVETVAAPTEYTNHKTLIRSIHYQVVNIGASRATITHSSTAQWPITTPRASRPGNDLYVSNLEEPRTLESGESWAASTDGRVIQKALEIGVHLGHVPLYFLGYIEYLDAVNVRRRTSFLRRFVLNDESLIREENPDYEYAD